MPTSSCQQIKKQLVWAKPVMKLNIDHWILWQARNRVDTLFFTFSHISPHFTFNVFFFLKMNQLGKRDAIFDKVFDWSCRSLYFHTRHTVESFPVSVSLDHNHTHLWDRKFRPFPNPGEMGNICYTDSKQLIHSPKNPLTGPSPYLQYCLRHLKWLNANS